MSDEQQHDVSGHGRRGASGEACWATCSCGWKSPDRQHITDMWRDVEEHKAEASILSQPYV